MPTSQNGWPVIDRSDCYSWTLTSSLPPIPLVRGPGGFLLAHFALWHHDVIEALGGRVLDDWGYAYRPIRGRLTGWSNHASGTAMDLNAQLHPLGVRHTYQAKQIRTIRTRLGQRYDGAIAWGGDWRGRPDEMHYELALRPSEARAAADRLRHTARGRRLVSRNLAVTRW